MKILLSTGVLHGHDLGSVMKLAAGLGLDGVELITATLGASFDTEAIRKLQKSHKMKVLSVHMPFFSKGLLCYMLNPRARSEEMVALSVKLASELCARNIVIHPFPTILMRGRIRGMMRSVLKSHTKPGIEFSIENLERRRFLGFEFEPYCISDYDGIHVFCEENGFSMTLDTSHCMSKGIEPGDFFRVHRDLINNIHVSNFRDMQSHYPLESGIIDFKKFFSVINEGSYDGYLTLEINPTTAGQVRHDIGFIRRCLS